MMLNYLSALTRQIHPDPAARARWRRQFDSQCVATRGAEVGRRRAGAQPLLESLEPLRQDPRYLSGSWEL